MAWTRAAALSELPDGSPHGVRVGTTALVLVRRGDRVHAFDALCPHKFAPLSEGTLEGDCLACPVHDAHFQMDGTPRDGDSWAGTLATFPVRLAGDAVEVDL